MLKPGLMMMLASAAVASARQCRNLTVPVSISSRNAILDLVPPSTEIEVTNLLLNMARPGINGTANVVKGYKTVSGDYQLAATYCEPDGGPGHALQILTHGVGFDRSYWDLSFANYKYSYVNRALDAGYSTLSWDRLGIGRSSHGHPVDEIQLPLEISALKALTDAARGGHLCGVAHAFRKTVHLGHSFGSAMTYSLAAMYPNTTDAIVLTGFSQVPQFMAYFALGGNFAPVADNRRLSSQYAAGYIAPKDSIGIHINFFGPDDFDTELLRLATETGQPAAVGELLTVGSVPKSSDFRGPVMVITGDRDIPFCGGNCMDTKAIDDSAANLIEYSRGSFKHASAFQATVVPKAGHGLNYNSNAPDVYRSITDFLKATF
ncbi:uncharacterized protein MAM_02584 [Metarhizium album ARSEF 1941]|uniref:AB hydrolase-1 domain-containing protein n=1 Tax=Metarhizium album (strain ARSEF 1941) TaxID=1081103 RepID=A0A0B2WUI4_METAS|nr:uncharacterized protein MAM_02584 [Metarhizium album ARSEF 1941]KHN99731.1 hypothetical protein MAM_02584 [Metarhizium album ARSEF 1941]